MPAKEVKEMVLYEASVYYGVAGAGATTALGYCLEEDTVGIAFLAPAGFAIRVQGKKFPIRYVIPNRDCKITFPAAQITEDIAALALGVTAVGNVVTLGDANDPILSPQVSVAVIGQDLNGDVVRLDVPYASASGETETSFSQAVLSKMPIVFSAEGDGNPYLTFGDIAATISAGGVLTRTQAVHSVVGAGGVADVLDSIAGTAALPLVNGEQLTLIPSTVAYDITMTHLNDTLELFGDANFLLGTSSGITARIDLKYDVTDDCWVEERRYVLPT